VGDAKQPALEIIHPGALGSRVKGLDEGILQYILAIDRRSRHARAVAMKAVAAVLSDDPRIRPCSCIETYGASALCSAKDRTPMSMRIFDRLVGL